MQDIASLLERFGLVVVFLNALLEACALPLPVYPTVLAAAAVAATDVQLGTIVLAGAAGAFIADSGWFWNGRRNGRRMVSLLCKLSLSPDYCVRKTDTLFQRIGPRALLFVKFLPGLSTLTVTLAGTARIGWARFALFDTAGLIIYFGVAVLLGRLFHDLILALLGSLARMRDVAVIVLVAAFALYWLFRWWRRHRFIRKLRMDRITVPELLQRLQDAIPPVLLDARTAIERELEGVIPGAVPAYVQDPEEFASLQAHFSPQTEFVIYCSCPNEASAVTAAQRLQRAGFSRIRPLLGGTEAWSEAGQPLQILQGMQS